MRSQNYPKWLPLPWKQKMQNFENFKFCLKINSEYGFASWLEEGATSAIACNCKDLWLKGPQFSSYYYYSYSSSPVKVSASFLRDYLSKLNKTLLDCCPT